MNSRSWPLVAVLALCACVAVASSVYVLSGGTGMRFVITGLGFSIALSAIASIALAALMSNASTALRGQVKSDLMGYERRLRDERLRSENMSEELAELRELSNRTNATISSGFAELRESYSALNEQLRSTVSTVTNFHTARSYAAQMPRPAPDFFAARPHSPLYGSPAHQAPAFPPEVEEADDYVEPRQATPVVPSYEDTPGELPLQAQAGYDEPMHPHHAAPAPEQPQAGEDNVDRLVVSLEPVVDLFTTRTAHYRLHLGMAKPEGGEVAHDVLLHHADRTGLRPEFDVFAAREALQLLEHLRGRDPALNIFMPIGPSTLQSASALDRILADREAHYAVADGVVLELPHAMLAGLSDAGLEGLARLARAGVILSLANAAVSGIDLAALSKLNVRFLSLSAIATGGAEGPTPQMIAFTQNARASRIQAIVTGVVDRRLVSKLTKITRFAAGPAFAEPRRVRSDATRNARGAVGIAA